ncbi:MAG: DUF3313 family protein [Gammaproteobacteria bacterium]|jgi:hypothetical protein|nr:DUF3313 family protein [Gammaproteobacteria bacterium]
MKIARSSSCLAVALAFSLLAGVSPVHADEVAHSGFLPDYSQLEKQKDAKGSELLRWQSPNLSKANYQKILLEPVTFYPEPQASEQVSDQVLKDIQAYLDSSLRTVGLANVPQATEAGPGVLRIKVAITAVETSSSGLKPWQLIPVALVVQGAKAASGNRPRDVDLDVEALVSDSVSGEVLAMSVRKGKGQDLKDSDAQLTLDDAKPRIDQWAENVAELVQKIFN